MKQNSRLLAGQESFIVVCRSMGLLLAIILLGISDTLVAQEDASNKVVVDFDKTADFSKYKTYKFIAAKIVTEAGFVDATTNMPVKTRVETALNKQLTAKGLTLSDQNPDLLINYIGGVKNREQAKQVSQDNTYNNWAPAAWYGDQWNEWWSNDYKKGTLVIDLVDVKGEKMVWRAYCTGDVHKSEAESSIKEAIAKAFTKYPPKKVKGAKSSTKSTP
jgi:hypothetical protein